MVKKRAVVKFGGAELRSGESFKQAAEMIKAAGFEEVAVVVSAMGKTTDSLINYVKGVGKISEADYADIVSMGERISARIFCSALKALGLNSVYFDPQGQDWPIITDSNFLEAEPDLEETRGKVENAEGVLSADPSIVPDAKPLKKVSIEEMFSLVQGGAKIVHPKALKCKLPYQKLRVVSFHNGLSSEGTEIIGAFFNPFEVRRYNGLCAVTLVGELNAAGLGKALMTFVDEKIAGISTGRNSITVFVEIKDKKALLLLCQIGEFNGVSLKEKIGAIEVLSPEFIECPGWVAKISEALAEKGINIVEISSSKATITVFLEEKDLKKALEAIKTISD